MQKMIEVSNLSFGYGKTPVFSRIGFDLYRGDFAAMIGSNGVGKSTLFRLMLGELTPSEGVLRIFNQDVSRFRDWTRVGYVPQNVTRMGMDFPASVAEIVQANLFSQVGLCRFPKRRHREQVDRALEQVGMAAYRGRLIGELSGGQQQRVMLARVLVADPELMLLDEPTSGVDAATVESLYQLLGQLNRERGMTIAMVTHDMARISRHASRVLCLEEGSMVELSRCQIERELTHRHKHPPADACAGDEEDGHGHSSV